MDKPMTTKQSKSRARDAHAVAVAAATRAWATYAACVAGGLADAASRAWDDYTDAVDQAVAAATVMYEAQS